MVANSDSLRDFTSKGGRLVLWGLTPAGLADFNTIVGQNHLIRPFRHDWVEMTARQDTILAELNQMDFWFVDPQTVAGQAGGGYMVRNDVFTHVVSLDDIAPFCKLPDPAYWGKDNTGPGNDHWPANMVNGRDTQWQQGFTLILDENQPTKWTMALPGKQCLVGMGITPDAKYGKITKVRLGFDEGEPIEFRLTPEQVRQDFAFPARNATSVTLELAAWKPHEKVNAIGVMNIWLKIARPKNREQKVRPLTNIGVLVKYPMGKGAIILNQLNVLAREPNALDAGKKRRIVEVLLGTDKNRPINLLFVGNSFTFRHAVNKLVCRIAVAAGLDMPNMHAQLMGGSRLERHLKRIDDEGDENVIFKALPAGQKWDYIVIQEFSSAPTTVSGPEESIAQFHRNALKLYSIVQKHSPGVTAILYETWARPIRPAGEKRWPYTPEYTQQQMQRELHENYARAAETIAALKGGKARLAPCGQVWKKLKWNLNLYDRQKDKKNPTKILIDYHQGPRGALLNAIVLYETIYQADVCKIEIDGNKHVAEILKNLDLKQADWARLTSAIKAVLSRKNSALHPAHV